MLRIQNSLRMQPNARCEWRALCRDTTHGNSLSLTRPSSEAPGTLVLWMPQPAGGGGVRGPQCWASEPTPDRRPPSCWPPALWSPLTLPPPSLSLVRFLPRDAAHTGGHALPSRPVSSLTGSLCPRGPLIPTPAEWGARTPHLAAHSTHPPPGPPAPRDRAWAGPCLKAPVPWLVGLRGQSIGPRTGGPRGDGAALTGSGVAGAEQQPQEHPRGPRHPEARPPRTPWATVGTATRFLASLRRAFPGIPGPGPPLPSPSPPAARLRARGTHLCCPCGPIPCGLGAGTRRRAPRRCGDPGDGPACRSSQGPRFPQSRGSGRGWCSTRGIQPLPGHCRCKMLLEGKGRGSVWVRPALSLLLNARGSIMLGLTRGISCF